MARSGENNQGVIGQYNNNVQGGLQRGGGKMLSEIGHNQRALSNINRSLVGAPPYPCAINKRVLSEKYAAQMANKQQALPPPPSQQAGQIIQRRKIYLNANAIQQVNNKGN